MLKQWTWRWPKLGVDLIVPPLTVSVFDRHRQRFLQKERGGLLFVDPQSPDGLTLIWATPPHKADRAGPFELSIDPRRGRNEITSANRQGWRLVGYWHTHPQQVPTLSTTDLASFHRLASRNPEHLPLPVAIIVGRSSRPDGIRAWSIRPEGVLQADLVEHLSHQSLV